MKVVLFEPRKNEIEGVAPTKELKRNYLGFIYKSDLNAFIQSFIEKCKEYGETVNQTFKYKDEIRLEFKHSPLIEEIVWLNARPTYEVGLLFEELDSERLLVAVYFNIRNKALTRLKKFLLENILEVQKEAVKEGVPG